MICTAGSTADDPNAHTCTLAQCYTLAFAWPSPERRVRALTFALQAPSNKVTQTLTFAAVCIVKRVIRATKPATQPTEPAGATAAQQ